ncbi:hypothetical protein SAMN05660359_03875 [Geodermatophilus obscurus]|uniref:Uncharacterized protein n=1 Tax=Geodermatophilus obscurus TaxID=1861 RepID=A0A1I5HPQ0_9ACTN|nr:hypothetical protein [Geodermatophilus obscurus]SFO49970.1 hypothetical protein SAMN05660359_03875 [Geodermatophilus obscurus]
MIWESGPWRHELAQVADRLEKRRTQRRWTQQTSFLVERDVMVSAYAVRKLHEARKVSEKVATSPIPVQRHQLIGQTPDILRTDDLGAYDFEDVTTTTLTLRELCNQFIHSYVFVLAAGDDGSALDGVFVASDRERRRAVYWVGLADLIEAFRRVAYEDIVHVEFRMNERGERELYDMAGVDVRHQELPWSSADDDLQESPR